MASSSLRKLHLALALVLAASLGSAAAGYRDEWRDEWRHERRDETASRARRAVDDGTRPSARSEARGWQFYRVLVSALVGADDEFDPDVFSAALARWQRERGLIESGLVDDETWSHMTETWQSRRIRDRLYPDPSDLVTAPPGDFYDPERAPELRQVERAAYAAYRRLVAAAIADPSLNLGVGPDGQLAPEEKYLKIVSAFRTREYQTRLRRQQPRAGRAQLAVNSPHFTGRALDLYVGGDPTETREANRAWQMRTPVYRWLARHASRFGFHPYYYEPWHWEYSPGETASQ